MGVNVAPLRRGKQGLVSDNDNREASIMKAVAKTVEPAGDREARLDNIRPLYLEALTLVERLHRRLLDVIKDEFDRRSRADINSVQALLLYNIGDKELTADVIQGMSIKP